MTDKNDKDTARVLVVEDDALVALFTTDILSDAGYEIVDPAYQLETAVALAKTAAMDAAVLDVNLAGAAVWPAVQILQDRDIPFILLSGFGEALDTPEFRRNASILAKPISGKELEVAVDVIISRKSSET